jgi:hypothetical protein
LCFINIGIGKQLRAQGLSRRRASGGVPHGVQRGQAQMQVGRSVRTQLLAVLAVGISTSLLLGGCTSGVFPAILDDPAPRDDTTMSPAQVKQATADLISERDHLCTEALATEGARASAVAAANCGTPAGVTGTTPNAGGVARP